MTKMENEERKMKENLPGYLLKYQSIHTPGSLSCAECSGYIFDKYYMEVDGRTLHEKCVHCVSCHQHLSGSCFSRNSKLYCRDCYKRLQSCKRCLEIISGEDLVMRVDTDLYHVTCFSCNSCEKLLKTGDHFHSLQDVTKHKICCKTCYETINKEESIETYPANQNSYEDASFRHQFPPSVFNKQIPDYSLHMPCILNKNGLSTSSTTSSSDSKNLKRPRTILTTSQRKKFKASFEISQKPCRKVRETLANETGLTARVVQVWFQNQRAKMKKIARRQSQGQECGATEDKKHDSDSDSENDVTSSPGSYASAPTPHQAQYYNEFPIYTPLQTTLGWEQPIAAPSTLYQYKNCVDENDAKMNEFTLSQIEPLSCSTESNSHHMPFENIDHAHPTQSNFVPWHESSVKHDCTRDDVINSPDAMNCNAYFDNSTTSLSSADASNSNPMDSLKFMQSNYFTK